MLCTSCIIFYYFEKSVAIGLPNNIIVIPVIMPKTISQVKMMNAYCFARRGFIAPNAFPTNTLAETHIPKPTEKRRLTRFIATPCTANACDEILAAKMACT